MARSVSIDVIDGIAMITLNRPENRNALNEEVLSDLISGFTALDGRKDIDSIILTGAGTKAFCAGADLHQFAEPHEKGALTAELHLFVDLFLVLQHLGKPVIAAVNGDALAGGFGLMLACDLVVASVDARFGTPEIGVGLWPMMITALIRQHIGRKQMMELFLTGKRIDAKKARKWGLVNEVVPADDVLVVATTLAKECGSWSPLVLKTGRRTSYAVEGMPYPDALTLLHHELSIIADSDDVREGASAFLEKRDPAFTGK